MVGVYVVQKTFPTDIISYTELVVSFVGLMGVCRPIMDNKRSNMANNRSAAAKRQNTRKRFLKPFTFPIQYRVAIQARIGLAVDSFTGTR